METTETRFYPSADEAVRGEIKHLFERCESLEQVIDYWCIEKKGALSVGVVLHDDDDRVIPGAIGICLDHPETKDELALVTVDQSIVEHEERGCKVIGASRSSGHKRHTFGDHDNEEWDSWMTGLGFTFSDAIMARVGPKSAALPLLLSFVLSEGGSVEVEQAHIEWFEEEDVAEDLRSEGLDMRDFISLSPYILGTKRRGIHERFCYDPIYCRKSTA